MHRATQPTPLRITLRFSLSRHYYQIPASKASQTTPTRSFMPHTYPSSMPVGYLMTGTPLPVRFRSSSMRSRSSSLEGLHLQSDIPFDECSDLWFHDGNIIILAGGFGFRVHRGQLRRHSEVFADMLGLPISDDRVRLHDAPSDVYHFLKALYDGACVVDPSPPVYRV